MHRAGAGGFPHFVLGVGNEDLLEPLDDLRKRIAERVPTISVEANGSASINISLERSAAVNGTILFDDGSPAPGIEVQLRERKQGKWVPVHKVVGVLLRQRTAPQRCQVLPTHQGRRAPR